ncbi:MAG: hypothetical protein P4L45_07280 [Ignavibacteriaceae bacterium]|nr:hypothetical protein [Ignavibacteriaceae bacterium]
MLILANIPLAVESHENQPLKGKKGHLIPATPEPSNPITLLGKVPNPASNWPEADLYTLKYSVIKFL